MKYLAALSAMLVFTLCGSACAKPAPPTPAPYFVGDFEPGNLSQWPYLGDANGVTVVSTPTFNGASHYAARADTTNAADSSNGGDASYVEQNSFALPWENQGSDVWFHEEVLLPSGTDSRYPGEWFGYPYGSGGWNMFMEWHNQPGFGPGSPYFGAQTNSDGSHKLILRLWGGDEQHPTSLIVHDPVTDANGLLYDHWYDVLVRMKWNANPTKGYVEWWIDGQRAFAGAFPTLWKDTNHSNGGGVGGVLFETGHYRGPSSSWTDTVYWDGVKAGPTRASVGG